MILDVYPRPTLGKPTNGNKVKLNIYTLHLDI